MDRQGCYIALAALRTLSAPQPKRGLISYFRALVGSRLGFGGEDPDDAYRQFTAAAGRLLLMSAVSVPYKSEDVLRTPRDVVERSGKGISAFETPLLTTRRRLKPTR
jgi:hypothetical protein